VHAAAIFIADACCGTPNTTFVFIEPLFLSLDARPLSHSHCNRLSCTIIFSTSRRKNPEEKTPAMEKNDTSGAFNVAAGASGADTSAAGASSVGTSAAGASAAAPVQDPIAASDVAVGTSATGALAAGVSAAAPVQAPVAASDVAAGASATDASAAAPVQFPVDWDPYEQEPYVAPENPYDTNIVDDEEVTLCSLVLIPFQSFLC
jgi:hypothetical protein